MKKNIITILLIMVATTGGYFAVVWWGPYNKLININFMSQDEQAKRRGPVEVTPLRYNGIRYIAPHYGTSPNNYRGGHVIAIAEKNGIHDDEPPEEILWDKEVYSTAYDKDEETDVQDVFITKLYVENGKLVVENERKEKFFLDLKTGEKLNGK